MRGFFGMAKVVRLYSWRQGTMTITRVWIEDGCISCGVAESICPEVFKLPDNIDVNSPNTVIEGANLSSFEDEIKNAAESCPVNVIMYE